MKFVNNSFHKGALIYEFIKLTGGFLGVVCLSPMLCLYVKFRTEFENVVITHCLNFTTLDSPRNKSVLGLRQRDAHSSNNSCKDETSAPYSG